MGLIGRSVCGWEGMVNVHPDTTVCIQPCHSHKPPGVMAGDSLSYCVVSLFSFFLLILLSFIKTTDRCLKHDYQGILSSKLPAQELG